MILAGDVGGTKTILALFSAGENGYVCVKKQRYASADFATFNELLGLFLANANHPQVSVVSIGVAGPIVNGDCHATNLPWLLNRSEIGQCTRAQKVLLINDLEASAWGLLALPEHQFVELNPNAEVLHGNHAVIAAGTGLGEAIMAWGGTKHHIIASEGGHSDFAPRNAQEIALLTFMLAKYPDHVSYERLVSGEGLVNIYRFLEQSGYAVADVDIETQLLEQDAAAVIGKIGVAGSDALCVEALRLFCRLYGAEAGNLALKCLPYAGVYLAGGIAAKILPVLKAGYFMDSFLAKGRCRQILQRLSVKVCMEADVALLGALDYALSRAVTL
ncbi:glucokinase [Crenothrix sp.]|uniref:glucokinase n=1 Tax=Crenothrix sp. TaxID=3100433 RepID=UPI00374D5BA7